MVEEKLTEIRADELMEKIRAEVSRRKICKTEAVRPFPAPPLILETASLADVKEPDHCSAQYPCSLEFKEGGYHIYDFLRFHDEDFVLNAFRGVLRRNPDPDGFEYFLKKLRSGKMAKEEIIGRLRYSPEGRIKKVRIRGLLMKFAILSSFRIPFLGYLLYIMAGIANLPVVLRNLRTMETAVSGQLQRYGSKTDEHGELISSINERLSKINERCPKSLRSEPLPEIADRLSERENLGTS